MKNKKYVLNCVDLSLFQIGVDFNILTPVPGADHQIYTRILDQEFIVDSDSIAYYLLLIDEKVKIDYNTSIVEVYFDQHPYFSQFNSTEKP